jgi:zinc protease
MARSNLKVVIVGNIDRAAATTLLDRVFGALPARAGLTETGGPTIARVAQPVAVPKDIPLATAAFGAASVASLHRDFPTLLVLNHIIGSGDFDATLMEEIRVKRGLAYSVSVSLINDASASIMLGGMATKTENMREALKLLEAVLRRTATEGPRPEQVENAKLYLTGSYLLDFDTNAKLAASLLRLWLAGREPSYLSLRNEDVRRVTVDDVRRLARELLAPDRFNIVVVGPKSLRD